MYFFSTCLGSLSILRVEDISCHVGEEQIWGEVDGVGKEGNCDVDGFGEFSSREAGRAAVLVPRWRWTKVTVARKLQATS